MSKKNSFTTAALAALATAGGMAAGVASAQAQTVTSPPPPTVTTRWNGSPETREEDRRFHVNGRLMYDVAYTDADLNALDGVRSYVRRAFLGVDGRLTDHWRYNVKFDFGLGNTQNQSITIPGQTISVGDLDSSGTIGDSPGEIIVTAPTTVTAQTNNSKIGLDDAYLEYAGDNFSIFVGNSNAVSPMEDRDSSLNIPFNERSFLITGGSFGKRPGVSFLTNGGNWSLGAGLQSNDDLTGLDTAANGTEAYFGIARGTWAPIYQQTPEGTTVLHLGATARYRDIGDGSNNSVGGVMNYNPGGLSNKQSNGAQVGGFESDTYLGAEFAFQYNQFGVEAEYGHFDATDNLANTAQLGDADANGYYVDFFFSPTGESRRYSASDGSFGAVSPLRTLGSDGGIGHIMLSARYEDMDLTDTNFGSNRNELTAYTIGATWVPISHVKFQLNYSSTDVDYEDPAKPDNTINAATLRTQFDW